MEQLLHFESGGRNASGTTVADEAAGFCRILPGIEFGARDRRSGTFQVISGYGHEVLVANPWLMAGSKRRKCKNDRIDTNKLARVGRVDPQSLVAARTELINVTRGLVKCIGTRLPKCSSPSFAQKVKEARPAEVREALLPLVRLADVSIQAMTRELNN
jgi:transposase